MKRICSWLLTIVLVLWLCACGQQGGGAGGDDWQSQYDLGVRYLSEGNYEEAIIAFTAAIEIDPMRPEAYVGRGGAYIGSGETAENLAAALADYEEAVALDETNAAAWLGIADVYIRQGDYDKALEILREALEKTENDQSIAGKLAEMERGIFTDSVGQMRRQNWYGEGGALTCYYTFTYDSQGREASVTSFDGAGNQLSCIENVYDQEGRLLSGIGMMSSAGQMQFCEYEYDAAGNQIQATYHTDASADSPVERQYRFAYDDDGNQIRQEHYDSTGTMQGYETYEYTDGLMTRTDNYYPDGTLSGYDLYEYNEDGQILKRSDYNADGELIYYFVYTYDENGNNTSYSAYDSDGTLIDYSTYE